MKKNAIFLGLVALFSMALSHADPVVFDTNDAHIIVVRPIDLWSPNVRTTESSLNAIKDRYSYYILNISESRSTSATHGFFLPKSDDTIINGVEQKLSEFKFRLKDTGGYMFTLRIPQNVKPSDFESIQKTQSALFHNLIIAQGDPREAIQKVAQKKWLGIALMVATAGIAQNKFGNIGGSTVGQTAIANDIQQLPLDYRKAVVPVVTPEFDATQFKAIDLRTAEFGDRVGQVIIAYKNEKTPDAENEALIKAIVTLTGADETVEDIQRQRDADYKNRLAIWDACVAEGSDPRCKP